MNNKTLLVIYPGKNVTKDSGFHILVAETGEGLASHYCSGSGFAYYDLYFHRPERIKEWTERFGEFEVKFIDETIIDEDELFEKNKIWYNSQKKIDVEEPVGF